MYRSINNTNNNL